MPAKWHKYSYSAQRQERRTAMFVIVFIALFAAIFWLVHSFLFTMYVVTSPTMEPGLSHGERVIATPLYDTAGKNRALVPLISRAARGDLALIEPDHPDSPGFFRYFLDSAVSFLTLQRVKPFSDSLSLVTKPVVRRIVGVPGDTVYLKKSVLHIKTSDSAHFLTEFENINGEYDINADVLPDGWTIDLPFSDSTEEITLGENEYYVLCDNRQTASDSRIWGPVSGDRIKAKVLFRYWPFSRFGSLD